MLALAEALVDADSLALTDALTLVTCWPDTDASPEAGLAREYRRTSVETRFKADATASSKLIHAYGECRRARRS